MILFFYKRSIEMFTNIGKRFQKTDLKPEANSLLLSGDGAPNKSRPQHGIFLK